MDRCVWWWWVCRCTSCRQPHLPPFLLSYPWASEEISFGVGGRRALGLLPAVCALLAPSYREKLALGCSPIFASTPRRLLSHTLPYSSTVPTAPHISCVADTQEIPSCCLIFMITLLLFIYQLLLIHHNRHCGVTVKQSESGAGPPAFKPFHHLEFG